MSPASPMTRRKAAVTPTNPLHTAVAGPGALVRSWRAGRLGGPRTLLLIAGTVPGAVGAMTRGFAVPGPHVPGRGQVRYRKSR